MTNRAKEEWPTGIAIELVQMTKTGRLSQYVERLSEPYQWLLENGWKVNHAATFVEVVQIGGVK